MFLSICLSVLGHRCKNKEAKNLPTTDDEHIYPTDTCGVAHDIRLTLMQRFFKDVSLLIWIIDLIIHESWENTLLTVYMLKHEKRGPLYFTYPLTHKPHKLRICE